MCVDFRQYGPARDLVQDVLGSRGATPDTQARARQLQDMRADLLRAADRAQTFRDFRRYVRELRQRKQAERDAERRRQAQDTVRVVP